MSAVGIGIIGVGVISDTYLENLGAFPDTEVLILGDLDRERARAQAEKYGIPGHGSAEDVLAHVEGTLVLHLRKRRASLGQVHLLHEHERLTRFGGSIDLAHTIPRPEVTLA